MGRCTDCGDQIVEVNVHCEDAKPGKQTWPTIVLVTVAITVVLIVIGYCGGRAGWWRPPCCEGVRVLDFDFELGADLAPETPRVA